MGIFLTEKKADFRVNYVLDPQRKIGFISRNVMQSNKLKPGS